MTARATAAEREQMARALATVEGEQRKAEAWAAVARSALWVTDAQRANLKNIQENRKLFEQWATVWRKWAEDGAEPSGRAYPVSHWLRIGSDLASALKAYTGGLYDGSVFAVVAKTAAAAPTAAVELARNAVDVAEAIAKPSLGLKIAAGSVAAVVLLAAVGYAVRAIR